MTKRWQIIRSVGMAVALLAAKAVALTNGFAPAIPADGMPALRFLPDAIALCLLACAPFARSRLNEQAFLCFFDGASFFLLGSIALFWPLSAYSLWALCYMPVPLLWIRGRYEKHAYASTAVWYGCVLAGVLAAALLSLLHQMQWAALLQAAACLMLAAILVDGLWKSLRIRKRSEEYERADGELLAADGSGRCLMRYDVRQKRLEIPKQAADWLGLPCVVENLSHAAAASSRIIPESRKAFQELIADIEAGKSAGSAFLGIQHPSEGTRWVYVDYSVLNDENDKPLRALVSTYQITGVQSKERAYYKHRMDCDNRAEQGAVYYEFNLTQDTITFCGGKPFFGMPAEAPAHIGELKAYLCEHMLPKEYIMAFDRLTDRDRLLLSYQQGNHIVNYEFPRLTEDEKRWTRLELRLLADPYSDDALAFCLLSDIEKEKERKLLEQHRNRTDELTGLLGRAAFAGRLNELLEHDEPEQQLHAVLMIDLDGFKAVNDTYGHGFGDKVLIEVATDLRAIQRSDDLIARLGGDEYIICLKNIPKDSGFISRRCNVIRRTLSKSYGDDVAISASIGVAFYPEHGKSFDELYHHADIALYRAKDAGRDRFVIYSEEMGRDAAATAERAAKPEPEAPAQEARRHTILIADDQRINRAILKEIFKDTYRILEAEDGRQALQILRDESHSVSAVVLDLLMPEVNGLDVLKAMQSDVLMQTIPVVVVSAAEEEEYSAKAIDLGAVDYVTKPIDTTLIRLRLRNAIVRRESENLRAQNRELLVQRANEARHQKQLRYVAEHDPVTHIYNKSAFYRKTRSMLTDNPDTEYCVVCFDILRFRAVNDIFGHEEGDRLLRYVAMQLQTIVGDNGTCSRISVDLFGACLPYDEESVEQLMCHMSQSLKSYDLSFEVQLWYGIYRIDDRTLPINQMQDRAVMAERTVKGSYVRNFAYYDDSMSLKLAEEQSMINDMTSALANEEFIVYYQTKCRLDTGKIVGAEALVRWNHPERGMLSPGQFVPIFERNGFIMRLDEYVWEKVCVYLAARRARDPQDDLCVSVNVSRANLYNPNLCQTLDRLCKQYGVPNNRMEVEITESAYVENAQLLLDLTDQLHKLGFVVEMDDFGSGYSSLNMLKEIPVDVLKLDMRFLYGIQNDARGGSILSSIISMARKLNMDVIAEGVENEEQARFLAAIGCKRAQGFYYDKPMPELDLTRRLEREKLEQAQVNDLESAKLHLSGLLCSAILLKLSGTRFELLCANEYYYRMMQVSEENFDRADRRLNERVGANDAERLIETMRKAREERKPCSCEYIQIDLRNRYHLMRASFQYVTELEDGYLYIMSLTDERQRV